VFKIYRPLGKIFAVTVSQVTSINFYYWSQYLLEPIWLAITSVSTLCVCTEYYVNFLPADFSWADTVQLLMCITKQLQWKSKIGWADFTFYQY